jgi:hypothetical protein
MRPVLSLLAAGLAWSLALPCHSVAPRSDAALAPTTSIVNCVGADRIAYRPGNTGVMLDAHEREQVTAQMFERYPMLANDGLVPSAIVLWHKPQGDWLYATLMEHPEQAGTWCFAAHVVANGLALTPRLMRKYFPAQAQSL